MNSQWKPAVRGGLFIAVMLAFGWLAVREAQGLDGPAALPADPCVTSFELAIACADHETAALLRIRAAFRPQDFDRAWWIAGCESGWTFHPLIENYGQFRRDTGQRWTPERARYIPAADRKDRRVYGIFQHRWEYWDERTGRAFPGRSLDPFNGWHNVLMAAWVAYELGWSHYHCDTLRR